MVIYHQNILGLLINTADVEMRSRASQNLKTVTPDHGRNNRPVMNWIVHSSFRVSFIIKRAWQHSDMESEDFWVVQLVTRNLSHSQTSQSYEVMSLTLRQTATFTVTLHLQNWTYLSYYAKSSIFFVICSVIFGKCVKITMVLDKTTTVNVNLDCEWKLVPQLGFPKLKIVGDFRSTVPNRSADNAQKGTCHFDTHYCHQRKKCDLQARARLEGKQTHTWSQMRWNSITCKGGFRGGRTGRAPAKFFSNKIFLIQYRIRGLRYRALSKNRIRSTRNFAI